MLPGFFNGSTSRVKGLISFALRCMGDFLTGSGDGGVLL